jgi:hypothetical protein
VIQQHDPMAEYAEQRARMASLVPRGRFTQDEDGTCILRGETRSCGTHLYEQAPGKLVGLYYVGGPCRYLRALDGLVVRHLAGDGEGILHLAWSPDLAERLPAFSRGRPRGVPFRPAAEAVSDPRSLAA